MERLASKICSLSLVLALVGLTACYSSTDPGPHHLQQAAEQRTQIGKQTGTQLKQPGNCAALEADLKAIAAAEIITLLEDWPPPDSTHGTPSAGGSNDNEGGAERDYTNNQVAGVDEADFAKTDGTRLFTLSQDALHRFEIPEAGRIEPAGRLEIEGTPAALLLSGDRLLVLSMIGTYYGTPQPAADIAFMLPETSKATLIEWRDGAAPSVITERYFDGRYFTARSLGGTAHVILHGRLANPVLDSLWSLVSEHKGIDDAKEAALNALDELDLDDLLPRSYVRDDSGSLLALPYTEEDCADFMIPEDSNGQGVTSLLSMHMVGDATFNAKHLLFNQPVVSVSSEHLFVAEAAQNWWWFRWNGDSPGRLNLHAFRLGDDSVTPVGSARIHGAPINQFAMDEHEGVLRVATWDGAGAWWGATGNISSSIFTLSIEENALSPLGEIRDIAPGEQLFAARFLDEMAYLVTFEMIDPLFTIDLSDPANPAIVGELKIPGFSTYLHPLANDHLLAVGIGGDDNGATWNTVVSLFDVSNAADPLMISQYDLAHDNSGWNWSEALYEHKAFQFRDDLGLLSVPLAASRVTNGTWEWVSSLELVRQDGDTLSHYGSIDHSSYFASTDYGYSPDIRRSFFIGDFIYAISSKAVTVHPVENPSVVVADALIAN